VRKLPYAWHGLVADDFCRQLRKYKERTPADKKTHQPKTEVMEQPVVSGFDRRSQPELLLSGTQPRISPCRGGRLEQFEQLLGVGHEQVPAMKPAY